jgi:PIN domain nuclease of toxin-antitoxin system
MRLLLDTHTFVWWLIDSPRLSLSAREAIANTDNDTLVSAVVGWECAIKHRLKRLPEAERFLSRSDEVLRRAGMEALPITMAHGMRAGSYPCAHRDPFDRMLAAQAELEDLTLVTRDPEFADFPVRTLW